MIKNFGYKVATVILSLIVVVTIIAHSPGSAFIPMVLTTTGTSGTSTYSSSTNTLNVPNYATTGTPSISTPTRSLSTTGSNNTFTISASRGSMAFYSVNFSVALLAALSSGIVDLDYSTDGGSNWTTISRGSQAYGVAITITTNQDQMVGGFIPANALVRINRVANTNCTITITKQSEAIMY